MGIDTTDIEKKNLEAHVELCAERYKFLETKLDAVEVKVEAVEKLIKSVHELVQRMSEKRNDQLISWGIGIISMLTGIIGWLIIDRLT